MTHYVIKVTNHLYFSIIVLERSFLDDFACRGIKFVVQGSLLSDEFSDIFDNDTALQRFIALKISFLIFSQLVKKAILSFESFKSHRTRWCSFKIIDLWGYTMKVGSTSLDEHISSPLARIIISQSLFHRGIDRTDLKTLRVLPLHNKGDRT